MSFKSIRVHEETYKAIVGQAELAGQQISYFLADLVGVHLLRHNAFYDLEVGESMAVKYDEEDISELSELRSKLGRDFTLHPNPDRDDDVAIEDFKPYLLKRVK